MASMRLMISGGRGDLAQSISNYFTDKGWVVEAPGRDELDVGDKEAVCAWFKGREPFDLVICNAGITRDALFLKQQEGVWDDVMATNLGGAAWCAKCAADGMRRRKSGHIIFIGSYIAEHPKMGQVLYSSSKAALKGLVKSLAAEWGRLGIRVNLVYPGFMETKMTEELPEAVRDQARDRHVLGQFSTPGQAARFILFLHDEMTATSAQLFSLDSRII